MIVVKLIGGLGNQMFQYALGKKLALENNHELLLDCSFFNETGTHTPRQYELDVFKLNASIASEEQLALFRSKNESGIAGMFHRFFPFARDYRTFSERGHQFQPEVLNVSGNTLFIGYWQSELYFSDIRTELLQEFEFAASLAGLNEELAIKITTCNAVSLHIRRGDYVSNASANSFHGLCDLDYYQRGMDYLQRHETDLELFVFSDDIAWAKDHLHFNLPMTFIDHNKGKGSSEDMRLMSMCKHNIIANSSFSWWGAWLNTYAKKRVVAPKKWFLDDAINTENIIPTSWIQL
jgi:hypothetical protein